MKTYTVKFSFKSKGISTEVQAESESMARQRILSQIVFHSVEEQRANLPNDFEVLFQKFRK
ncbi:MAG: hypothetical protein ACOYN4_20605 [Bacteroidales bacterium]